MASTTWTEADIAALESAIAAGRGARTINFSDQSVTFGSVSEMLALLGQMKAQVRGTDFTRYAAFSKGLTN